jgi:phospholipid/cholesterol/gamma-HCH transport system substrate-binding protein
MPGAGPGNLALGSTPAGAPIIDGDVSPDPSKALAAATKAFEKAGDTLQSINEAATGLAKITKSADNLDRLLTTWNGTGADVSGAAQGIKRFIAANETNFHDVFQKFNSTLDPETQKALKDGINRFSSAAARIDAGLSDLDPAFKDLGSKVNHTPTTDIGQAIRRLNLALADLELLTSKLRNPQGGLNTDGSLQKLLVQSDLHDNLNRMAVSANQAFVQLRTVLATLRQFAEKVANDPSIMTRGAFSR